MDQRVTVRDHDSDDKGGDEVTQEHRGVRQEGALMPMPGGDGEQEVKEHLEGQNEAEDPGSGAALVGHESAQGEGQGQEKYQQAGFRECAVPD